jgi:hypothetical protein
MPTGNCHAAEHHAHGSGKDTRCTLSRVDGLARSIGNNEHVRVYKALKT